MTEPSVEEVIWQEYSADCAGFRRVVLLSPPSPALSSVTHASHASHPTPPPPPPSTATDAESSSVVSVSSVDDHVDEAARRNGAEGEYAYLERVAALIQAAESGAKNGWTRSRALQRYREKKAVRTFKKRIRYESRKFLAESRPRVGGRFVKRSEVEMSGV